MTAVNFYHRPAHATRHGDELRIVNNGNEPWKRLCTNMGPLPSMMIMAVVVLVVMEVVDF